MPAPQARRPPAARPSRSADPPPADRARNAGRQGPRGRQPAQHPHGEKGEGLRLDDVTVEARGLDRLHRDAADVALTTSFGRMTLTKFVVVTDEVVAA